MITPPPINADFYLQDFLRQVREFLTLTKIVTLDFPSTAAGLTADLTVSFPGVNAVDNNTVVVTPPSTMVAGVSWCGFVPSNNFVTVRIHVSGAGAVDLASGVWRITVFKY